MRQQSTPQKPDRLFWTRAALICLMFGLFAMLVVLEKPWEMDIKERLAAGRYPKLDQFIQEGFWWAALINLAGCGVLLATSRWWSVPTENAGGGGAVSFGNSRGLRAIFFGLLCVAMIAGAVERWPKMDHSFGNDEEYAFRRLILGQIGVDEADRLKSPALEWRETLFNNRASNNHFLFTALARVSHDFYQWIAGERAHFFSERAARMPSFFAGILSIGLVGILLALAGRPRAGVAAAFLLAFNPWHLRYATEARGYAVMILFVLVALCALVLAIDTGRRRYWMAFAAAQTLYMLAFPGALHLALAMNAVAIFALARSIPAQEWRSGAWRWRSRPFWHFAAANLFSGMVFLQLFSPSIRQLALFLDQRAARGPMGIAWLRDVWAHLSSGMRWDMDDPENPMFLSIQHSLEQSQGATVLFLILMPVAVTAGLIRSFQGRPSRALLVAPTLLAALSAFAHVSVVGKFLYSWYVIYAVIGVTIGAALGVDWIGSIKPSHGRFAQAAPAVAAVICLTLLVTEYALHTEYPREAMAGRARQPIREAVKAAHSGNLDPYDLDGRPLLTAAVGTSAKQKFSYDPRIIPIETDDDVAIPALEALMAKAERMKMPLRVLVCNPSLIEREAPRLHERLGDPAGPFRLIEILHGLEAMFTYCIFEYRPRERDGT